MKNLRDRAKTIESKTSLMPYGIHTNVKIDNIEYNPDENYLDIFLSNQFGQVYKDRIFLPNINSSWLKKEDGTIDQEALAKEEDIFADKLIQYFLLYMDANEVPETLNKSYKEVAGKAYSILSAEIPKNPDLRVNLKLLPDKTGRYARSPRYGIYIEKYVEGQPTTLSFTKWEMDKISSVNAEKSIDDPESESKDISLF